MTFMSIEPSGLPDPITDPQFYRDVPGKRLIAWLIDTLLIGLASLLLVAATLFLTAFIFPLVFAVIHFVYRSYFLATHSATPGMRVMAIEIRNHSGDRLTAGEAILHTLAYSVVVAFIIPQLVGIFMMLTGPRGQGLHDLLVGTAAINRPAAHF